MNSLQSYRESAVLGATPVELTIRLYEQLIKDLRQVDQAIEQNDIRLRTNRVRHILLVIGHLQSSLNFDSGGQVVRNLEQFYNNLRQNVVQVQFQPSKHGVAQLITDLLSVRAAWMEVDRVERASAVTVSRVAAPAAEPDRQHMGWQG